MKIAQDTSDAVPGTQLVRRIAALVRVLGLHSRTGARLIDLCHETELGRSTVHRILQALIAERLVTQDHQSKRYFLGQALYELGLAAAPRLQLRDLCQPMLSAVAEQTGDTAFLTERAGFDGVCVDRKDGSFPIKAYVLEPGRRRPLSIGCGNLAILSALPDDEVRRLCNANASRIAEKYPHLTPEVVQQRIARTREQGYAHTEAMETAGVNSVAVCVRDGSGNPVAAISVSSVASRLEGIRVQQAATFLREAATQIEARLATLAGGTG